MNNFGCIYNVLGHGSDIQQEISQKPMSVSLSKSTHETTKESTASAEELHWKFYHAWISKVLSQSIPKRLLLGMILFGMVVYFFVSAGGIIDEFYE